MALDPAQAPTTPSTHRDDNCYCPIFHRVIELIGRRWTGAILKVLCDAPRSFGAIREEIPGLSDRLLTERLGELSSAGLVEKVPPDRSGTYHLTAMGQGLRPVFAEIDSFGEQWGDQIQPC